MISIELRRNSSRIILLQLTRYFAATALLYVPTFGITSFAGAQTPLAESSNATKKQLQQTQKALKLTKKKAKNLELKADRLEKAIVELRKDLITTARVILVHERRLELIKEEVKKLEASHKLILRLLKIAGVNWGRFSWVTTHSQKSARVVGRSAFNARRYVLWTIVLGSILYRLKGRR